MQSQENLPPASGSHQLTNSLYLELRKLAAARMANQYVPQTLQATALVHEAWLRVEGKGDKVWDNRGHFFGAVAEAMRNVLVDRARRRQALRHGGNLKRVDLEQIELGYGLHKSHRDDEELIALNEALEKLQLSDPRSADLIKMRYFAGLTVGELANVFEFSLRTTERRLAYARAWLEVEIKRAMAA